MTTGRIWGWPVRQGGCHEDLGVEEPGEVSWEGNKACLRPGKGLETSLGGKMVPGYRSPGKPGRGVIYDGTWKGKWEWGVLGRWLWRQDGRAGSWEEAGLGDLLGREICDPEDKLVLEPMRP